jgi:hypothetical protein
MSLPPTATNNPHRHIARFTMLDSIICVDDDTMVIGYGD